MIQIYKKSNMDYESNGDAVLQPELCEIDAELNGAWELTLKHPLDTEGNWKYIEEGAVIAAPSFISGKQLFRIYSKEKSNTGVNANARPVFMDAANEVFLMDARPTRKNGQEALNEMLHGQSRYKGVSDITTISTAYYIRKNFIEALQSDDENSFLNRWGGEVVYDNFLAHVKKRIGVNIGARAEMGFNCTGIEESVDTTGMATRIVPVAFNGHTLGEDKPWIDSEKIDYYPIIHTKIVEYPDIKLTKDCNEEEIGFDTIELLREELKRRCKLEYAGGADIPEVNYKCDFVEIRNLQIYKDLKGLEEIELGDTVSCKNRKIGIETSSRAIRIVYDCIKKRNNKVELGKFTRNYFNELTSIMKKADVAINDNGTLKGDKVEGIIDGMKAKLYAMHSTAQKQDVIAMLFEDTDINSETYGAMAMGTCGFMISQKQNHDGTWEWSTFGTGRGFIADLIVAGCLLSKNWKVDETGFRFNLDEGTINSKHLKLDQAGLLTLYKALITGGEIKINDKNGNRIFEVKEDSGFIFGGDGNGAIRYDIEDQILKMYKDTQLYGKITNYSRGRKAIEIGDSQVKVYSWQTDGNYVGGMGSTANKDDPNSRQSIALFSDTGDQLIIGYVSGIEGGTRKVSSFIWCDPNHVGNDPVDSSLRRSINFAEVPYIKGTLYMDIPIGPHKFYYRSGLLLKYEHGQTWSGTLKTGADENISITGGVITNVQ